jgi:hypothetical protein
LNNVQGSTVLDRATGVHELGLAIDVGASLFAQAVKLDEWGVAHCVWEPTLGHERDKRDRALAKRRLGVD